MLELNCLSYFDKKKIYWYNSPCQRFYRSDSWAVIQYLYLLVGALFQDRIIVHDYSLL